MRTLVLFTRDLRIHDHPALWEACRSSEEVIPLFVLDPRLIGVSPNRARFEILDALIVRKGERSGRELGCQGTDAVARPT